MGAVSASAAHAAGESLLADQRAFGAQQRVGCLLEFGWGGLVCGERAGLKLGWEQSDGFWVHTFEGAAARLPRAVAFATGSAAGGDVLRAVAGAVLAGAEVAGWAYAAGIAALRGEFRFGFAKGAGGEVEVGLGFGGFGIFLAMLVGVEGEKEDRGYEDCVGQTIGRKADDKKRSSAPRLAFTKTPHTG
jgi:hypothetical protein